jgi:hypothetical protein
MWWLRALLPERLALVHSEAMLLIDDHEAKVEEFDVVAEQGVRSDHDARTARNGGEQSLLTCRNRQLASEEHGPKSS